MHTFDSLGLITHPEKSDLIPTQRLTYLGFILDSKEMKIYLTPEKTDRLIKHCVDILKKPKSTVQKIASLVGMMTASFPAVMYGPLHYRSIDMDKNEALKKSKWNFNSSMTSYLRLLLKSYIGGQFLSLVHLMLCNTASKRLLYTVY